MHTHQHIITSYIQTVCVYKLSVNCDITALNTRAQIQWAHFTGTRVVDSWNADCIYMVNRRSRSACEDATLSTVGLLLLRINALCYLCMFITCAYVHLGANCCCQILQDTGAIYQCREFCTNPDLEFGNSH